MWSGLRASVSRFRERAEWLWLALWTRPFLVKAHPLVIFLAATVFFWLLGAGLAASHANMPAGRRFTYDATSTLCGAVCISSIVTLFWVAFQRDR